jgi:transcriptional regulator with GAF, ATPase, and Fis domain
MKPDQDDTRPAVPFGQFDPLDDLVEAEYLRQEFPPVPGEPASAPIDPRLQDRKNLALALSVERSFEAFRRAALSINAELDLRTLVKRIISVMVQTLNVERGVVFLALGSKGELVPAMALGIEGEDLDEVERVSRTIISIAQGGETVVTRDAMNDTRFRDIPSVQVKQIRSVLCAPLVAGGEAVGILYLDSLNAGRVFSTDAERFFKAFAEIAAVAVRNAQLHGALVQANSRLRSLSGAVGRSGQLIGISPAMDDLRKKAILAAQLRCPVLVLGETGTETELFARAVADARHDAHGVFFSYNCASDPPDLSERILFGGPVRRGPRSRGRGAGLVGSAAGGVLFLDEITALGLELQARLLPLLTHGPAPTPMPPGSDPLDVQLVAASSRDIAVEFDSGHFDMELHRRLSAFRVQIPPLRDRRGDIPVLAELFARKYAWLRGSQRPVSFTSEALALLQTWPWPRNVAELEELVQRLSARVTRSRVDVSTLERVAQRPTEPGRVASASALSDAGHVGGGVRTMAEVERDAIRQALVFTHRNKAWAARLLGMQRGTFLRKVRRYQITFPETSGVAGPEQAC